MTNKLPVLFICHRIPYPPNKGDKIATFNIMKFLSEHYDLHLATFVDEPEDRQYKKTVKQYCSSVKFVDICHKTNLSSGLKSILKGLPVSIAHYHSDEMQEFVDATLSHYNIKNVVVYSSGVAQFASGPQYSELNRLLNMTDIDSDKWRQYAAKKAFPASFIYNREARLLATHEQAYLKEFDKVSLVTSDETKLFKSMSPQSLHEKIITITNGVDTNYFDPSAEFDFTDKPVHQEKMVCFTGAMDYWANVDAVVWFCENVWPKVLNIVPEATFYVVGGKPTPQVQKLSELPGVIVTGRVVDVRPFIAAADVCVGPLQIARGIQNKMLEAMSMAKPVVMTSLAAEGIELNETQQQCITDDPIQFAELIVGVLSAPNNFIQEGVDNRNWITQKYGWEAALSPISKIFNVNDAKED